MAGPNGKKALKRHKVSITATGFNPVLLSIKPGDSVCWTNADAVPHAIMLDTPTPVAASPDIAPGGTCEHVFESPGTYQYHCTIHSRMKGTVTAR